ncbi:MULTISPECIES: DUF3455 domain-containing protein [Comamonas]|jgi:hypothetical protein|uniref:DUF3455 domain-containing protein n=1 Tax=Comamonas TaxID=283 RepID=UPI0028452E60|nr:MULTISPECIES: DUF3455 domain-containing protein [Comamonas]MDR3065240.1 DUF3455 domain-containing protein [Comamonas sp.]MEB5963648.1 DUF3455 domain-containing protein [Comamonas testosteroni]
MDAERVWGFAGPDAKPQTRSGTVIGKYGGPPATGENRDGSRVTATPLAVAPAGAGNIPLQPVQAHPTSGMEALQGVTYIQRVATRGGAAPMACAAVNLGRRQIVQYRADHIFWKAA